MTVHTHSVIWLRRKKGTRRAVLLAHYDYPVVRIRLMPQDRFGDVHPGSEMLVRYDEILTDTEKNQETIDRFKESLKAKHADIIAAWKPGMTPKQIADTTGRWVGGTWSIVRQLKRCGIIT